MFIGGRIMSGHGDQTNDDNSVRIGYLHSPSGTLLPTAALFDGGCGLFLNNARLRSSLRILRELNEARLHKRTDLVRNLESILQQHDWDARDRIDTRQLTIFDAITK
jgi:hypothetical protein